MKPKYGQLCKADDATKESNDIAYLGVFAPPTYTFLDRAVRVVRLPLPLGCNIRLTWLCCCDWAMDTAIGQASRGFDDAGMR